MQHSTHEFRARKQVKRIDEDESELVRMSVDPSIRGAGIGRLLVAALASFCRARGVLRLHLTTANPDAARFYARNGFLVAARSLTPSRLVVYRMLRHLADRREPRAPSCACRPRPAHARTPAAGSSAASPSSVAAASPLRAPTGPMPASQTRTC